MSPAIFVDANVPIYAAGRPHPLKEPCSLVLLLAAERPREFFTDAEVLQELLHRYLALRLWPQGREAFRHFADLMRGRTEAVQLADVERAALLADEHPNLSARDLLHVSVMSRTGTDLIVSADTGFDGFHEVRRLDPSEVDAWRQAVLE